MTGANAGKRWAFDDERRAFVIGAREVKLRHGSKMVETLPHVMQHLPKYKGKGPCGDV